MLTPFYRNFTIWLIGFVLTFLSLTQVFSQPIALQFKHITVADGLSQNMVSCILQDKQGFMWFGTWDGLNKYDGHTFTLYQNNPFDSASISGNRISDILEDKDGFLWIATAEGGLNRFDRRSGKFTRFLAGSHPSSKLYPPGRVAYDG